MNHLYNTVIVVFDVTETYVSKKETFDTELRDKYPGMNYIWTDDVNDAFAVTHPVLLLIESFGFKEFELIPTGGFNG